MLSARGVNVRALERAKSYATLFALGGICLAFAALSPTAFATTSNALNILRQIAFLVLVSVGATFVMAVGEFDLSVGAMASLGGVIGARLAVAGVPPPLGVLATLAAGFAVGIVNGAILTRFRVLSFITTLATGTILGGVTFWLTGGATIFENVPESFSLVGRGQFGAVSYPAWIMLAVTLCAAFVARNTVFGRHLYAIGGNPTAAFLAGIPVARLKILAFALCSSLAALAGVLLASRLGSAQPTGGNGLFLPAYAAVFLGVTASREGVPNVLGTVAGAAILGILANGLTILNCPTFLQDILTGVIVVAAVVLQQAGRR